MSRYVEGTARTNLLYCTDCNRDIKKNESVIFEITGKGKSRRMIHAWCSKCGRKYIGDIIESEEHPFSSEALGQE